MINSGFIYLHRSIMNYDWFKDYKTNHFFIYCLIRANHEDTKWRGIDIKRGQFLSSLDTMSFETGLSVQQVRTCLKKLKSTNNLTSKTTNKYHVITITNYDSFQDSNKLRNKQVTNNQQTSNKQVTIDNTPNTLNTPNNIKEKSLKKIFDFINKKFGDNTSKLWLEDLQIEETTDDFEIITTQSSIKLDYIKVNFLNDFQKVLHKEVKLQLRKEG